VILRIYLSMIPGVGTDFYADWRKEKAAGMHIVHPGRRTSANGD
jgi:hypothetical protein